MTRQGCQLTPPPKQILKHRNTMADRTRSRPIIRQVTEAAASAEKSFPKGRSEMPAGPPRESRAISLGPRGRRTRAVMVTDHPKVRLRPTPTPTAGKKNMFAKMLRNMGRLAADLQSSADHRRARAGSNRNSRAAERLKTPLQRVRT